MCLRLALLACLLCPALVQAAATARLTWQLETLAGCYRAVPDQYVEDGANVGIGVIGLAEPFTAYAVDLEIAAQDGQPLPDAWRYDADGCRGPAGVSWKTHASPGSPCGWLYDFAANPLPTTSVTYDGARLHLSLLLEVGAPADPFRAGSRWSRSRGSRPPRVATVRTSRRVSCCARCVFAARTARGSRPSARFP